MFSSRFGEASGLESIGHRWAFLNLREVALMMTMGVFS